MALLPALLLLLLPLAALAAALAAVLLGLPSYDIPPGVNQPAKLRLVLAVLLGTAALVSRALRRADGFGGREGVSSRAGGGGYTVPQVRPRRGPPAVRVGRHPRPMHQTPARGPRWEAKKEGAWVMIHTPPHLMGCVGLRIMRGALQRTLLISWAKLILRSEVARGSLTDIASPRCWFKSRIQS